MSDQEILNKRNIAALAEAAIRDRKRQDEQHDLIIKLQQTVTMQAQQIQRLEQLMAAAHARSFGRGGTT